LTSSLGRVPRPQVLRLTARLPGPLRGPPVQTVKPVSRSASTLPLLSTRSSSPFGVAVASSTAPINQPEWHHRMATKQTTTKALTPEAAAIAQNEAAKAALITAEEKAQALSLAVDAADLGVDDISDSWDAGDETSSAADFSLAQIEFRRATALYAAAQRSAQAIEKSIINVSTEPAEIVAPYIKATHPHVEVRTSFLAPPKGMPDPHKLIATVTQAEKIRSDGSGVVSGAVNIVFVRQPEHRELDRGQIEAAALKDGISLSISSQSRTEDGYEVDTLRCQANSAHAAVPALRNPTPADVSKFAQTLARTLCDMTRSTTDPYIRMLSGEHAGFTSQVASVIPIAFSEQLLPASA